jgi:hypothetical protein
VHGGDKKYVQKFQPENLRRKDYLKDLSLDGRTMLKWNIVESADWILLAHSRYQRRALVNISCADPDRGGDALYGGTV